jgi:hypothetical protein
MSPELDKITRNCSPGSVLMSHPFAVKDWCLKGNLKVARGLDKPKCYGRFTKAVQVF